jgi:hypothetical protein
MKEELAKTVRAKSISPDGLTNEGFEEAFQEIIRSSSQPNSPAAQSFSRRTLQKYRKALALSPVKGARRKKTSVRVLGEKTLRTQISLCCMLQCVQSIANRVNFHLVEEVSLLADPTAHSLKLLTSQEATDERAKGQRVISFQCTLSGYGQHVVTCIKLGDASFSSEPHIVQVEPNLYVALYRSGLDDQAINTQICHQVILPAVHSVRARYLQAAAAVDQQNRYRFIAIAQDGALGPVQAIENTSAPLCQDHNSDILWITDAAGALLCPSPSGKGQIHTTLETLFQSANLRYESTCPPEGEGWTQLQQILSERLDPESLWTVWRVLIQSREMLSEALNADAITSAYLEAGIVCPPDGLCSPQVILSQSPHWVKLSSEDRRWVLDKIPEFTEIFIDNGCLPEDSFESLQDRPHVDDCPQVTNTHRHRAMVTGVTHLRLYSQSQQAKRAGHQEQPSNR